MLRLVLLELKVSLPPPPQLQAPIFLLLLLLRSRPSHVNPVRLSFRSSSRLFLLPVALYPSELSGQKTLWMFVSSPEEAAQRGIIISKPSVLCSLGCISKDNGSQARYSAPNTGLIKRHLESKHADSLSQFNTCKQTGQGWNELEKKVVHLISLSSRFLLQCSFRSRK